MPFINTKVNVEICKEKETILKEKLGKAISLLPGKSENWLMLGFEDNCRLYFRGRKDEPTAFVEVKVYGAANRDAFEKLTAEITQILGSELSIAPDHIYVKYEACEHWGYNGGNF